MRETTHVRGVIGNQQAQAILDRALVSGQNGHAYLLHGPEGVGKLTMALAFAQALLCLNRQPGQADACGECVSCRKTLHGNHPDLAILEPEDGKRWIKVDALREMQRIASLAPAESDHRIIIIPEMERIQEGTTNTLLKTLEEPPDGVIMLLLATEADGVLPTILSRCQLIQLRPLAPHEISAALHDRWQMSAADADRLAGLANGRLGWAVRAHEHPEEQEERERLLERIASLGAATRDERMRTAATLGSDNATARLTLEQWIAWWRDVTLAANGAHNLLSSGKALREAERTGAAIGPQEARVFMQALLAALASMDINANPRLTLENLALQLPSMRTQATR